MFFVRGRCFETALFLTMPLERRMIFSDFSVKSAFFVLIFLLLTACILHILPTQHKVLTQILQTQNLFSALNVPQMHALVLSQKLHGKHTSFVEKATQPTQCFVAENNTADTETTQQTQETTQPTQCFGH